MHQQHRQEMHRYHTRTLPVHPRQQDMRHHADVMSQLVQHGMPNWRHNRYLFCEARQVFILLGTTGIYFVRSREGTLGGTCNCEP